MTKLGYVSFDYHSSDHKKPWRFVSEDGRLRLVFEPFFERAAKTNLLLLKSEAHHLFGKYSGHLVADDGEKFEISDLVGWAEEHNARW